jgi:hypothetical protein
LQAYLNIQLVPVTDLEGCQIFSAMNISSWGWNFRDQLSEEVTIVLVICISNKTFLTNFLGD